MASALDIELHALVEETSATGTSTALDIGEIRSAAKLELQVTLHTGSVIIKLMTSVDPDDGFRQVGAFDEIPAGGSNRKQILHFDDLDRFVRIDWTIAPNATFSVKGEAHQLYATQQDLYAQIPARFLESIPNDVRAAALIKASCDGEDALSSANALPITKFPASLVQRVAAIATYQAMMFKGFLPEGTDELIVKNFDDANKWLLKVAERKLKPPGLEPVAHLDVKVSSGDPLKPDVHPSRFSDNWGDFG